MSASVFVATSLDGFIAREDGSLDWLPQGGGDHDGDYGYAEFVDSIDAIVMGRNTYEQVLAFGSWPYGEKPVFVLSSRGVAIPESIAGSVATLSGSPAEVARRLAARGFDHLYVDGGKTIQGFLRAGLVRQLIITRVPILIGRGIPLFGPLPHDVRLHHLETHWFRDGLVQSRYEVIEQ